MNATQKYPTPGQYVYILKNNIQLPAECFKGSTGLYALVPGDLQQIKYNPIVTGWLPIPPPTENWTKWIEQSPPIDNYVYIRDPQHPHDYELALIIGSSGNVRAILPIDPFSHHEEKEWQSLKPPID